MLLPDIDNSNTGRSNLGFGYNDRPERQRRRVGDVARRRMPGSTPEAFSMPPFGTFGNSGRNTLSGPGYHEPEPRAREALPRSAHGRGSICAPRRST